MFRVFLTKYCRRLDELEKGEKVVIKDEKPTAARGIVFISKRIVTAAEKDLAGKSSFPVPDTL
jgi:hypothetical protein